MKAQIEEEYKRLGHVDGWVFASTPISTMKTAHTIFVGLNPGGSDDSNAFFEEPEGNAWFLREAENGGHRKVEMAVRAFHDWLDIDPDDAFYAQLIPFASRNWNELKNREESVKFGKRLWSWVRENSNPKRIICFGTSWTFPVIRELWDGGEVENIDAHWGGGKHKRAVTPDGIAIAGILHPSRYALYSEASGPERREAVMKATRLAD